MKKIKAKIRYWIERIKRLGRITKRNFVRYRDDLRWEISHPHYYAKKIADNKGLQTPIIDPSLAPPLAKEAFPFDKEKAQEALNDVNRWIVKENLEKRVSKKAQRKSRDKN